MVEGRGPDGRRGPLGRRPVIRALSTQHRRCGPAFQLNPPQGRTDKFLCHQQQVPVPGSLARLSLIT